MKPHSKQSFSKNSNLNNEGRNSLPQNVSIRTPIQVSSEDMLESRSSFLNESTLLTSTFPVEQSNEVIEPQIQAVGTSPTSDDVPENLMPGPPNQNNSLVCGDRKQSKNIPIPQPQVQQTAPGKTLLFAQS